MHACKRWHSQPSLWVRAPSLSTEFVTRKVKGRRARLLPRSGQPPEITLLRRGEIVNVPVLNQEHPLTQHVTSEIFSFGNITASYNAILVMDGNLVTLELLCSTHVEQSQNTGKLLYQMFLFTLKAFQLIVKSLLLYLHFKGKLNCGRDKQVQFHIITSQ